MPLIKFEVLFQCKLIFSKGLGYLGGGDIFLLTTGFLDHFYLVCLLIWFDLNLPPWFFICPSVFCFLSLLFLSSFGLSIFMILFYLLYWFMRYRSSSCYFSSCFRIYIIYLSYYNLTSHDITTFYV